MPSIFPLPAFFFFFFTRIRLSRGGRGGGGYVRGDLGVLPLRLCREREGKEKREASRTGAEVHKGDLSHAADEKIESGK